MYAKAERSVKYGMLFIILPFIAFFLLEVFSKNRIHMLQYLMVGAANTIFYLLLLSLSEHIGFNTAYLIGAAATSALIVLYSTAILPTKKQGLIMAPVLVALYTFLFTVLQSEDYALLIGSLGLFALVALVMMLTRKVDWYSLNQLFSKSE
jgi:inner membrane protein